MYTRLWKLITKHMEENSRMAVFLTSAMLIWTIGITMAGILVCIIKHMNVICRLSDLICAGIYAGLVFGLFGGGVSRPSRKQCTYTFSTPCLFASSRSP